MTKDDIDKMWGQAMNESIKNGEAFTRYRFANLVAAHKAEVALAEAYRCGHEAGAVAEREACAKWLDFYDGPNGRRAEGIRERIDK